MRKRKLIIRLIKALVLVLVLVGSLVAAHLFLTKMTEEADAKVKKLDAAVSSKNTEFEALKKEVANSKDAYEFYLAFKDTESADDDSFRKGRVRHILGEIKTKLSLNRLSYKMELFSELAGEQYSKEHAATIKTSIVIEFAAIDDIRAMRFLREIEKNFPGHVYIKSFSMSSTKDKISDVELLGISSGTIPDLVEGKIEFDWYGLKLKEEVPAGGQDA